MTLLECEALEVIGKIRENAHVLVTLIPEDALGGVTSRRLLDLARSLELLLQVEKLKVRP